MERLSLAWRWVARLMFVAALAFCLAPTNAYAVVNLGTVSVSVPDSVAVDSGGSVSVSTPCSPAYSDQYPNCLNDYCPSGCDFGQVGDGTGCEESATGQCTCFGYATSRYYPTCTVASSDPSVARATWSDGVLTVVGYKPGTAVVTVYPSLRLFSEAPASMTVTVTGSDAGAAAVVDGGSGGGGTAGGGGAAAVVRQSEAAQVQSQGGSESAGGSVSGGSGGSGVVTVVNTIERAAVVSESAEASSDGSVKTEDGSVVAHLDDTAVNVASILSDAAGKNVLVTLWGGKAAEAPDYVWEIAGVKLPTDGDFADVDLKLADAGRSAALDAVLGDAAYTAFTVTGSGKLPSTMQLLWRTDNAIDNDQVVDVYRLDEATGTFKKVHSNLRTGEGYVVFNLIDRGTYVVTSDSELEGVPYESAAGEAAPAAADDAADDAGGMPAWAVAVAAVCAVVVAVAAFMLARGRKGAA